MDKNQVSDVGVERYLEVFLRDVSLDNHRPDHVRVSLARTICTELARRGRWNDVDLLFTNALARDIDSYRENEDILRVEIANEHRKGNHTKVCLLLENGSFRDGKDLIKVWDECHYNLRRAPNLPRTALAKYRIRQKYPPPKSICPAGLREKISIKSFSRKILMEFYQRNSNYPSTEQKKQLAKTAGLTSTQVHNWFTNMRRKVRNKAGETREMPNVVTESDHAMQNPQCSCETKRCLRTSPETKISTTLTQVGSGARSCSVGHMGQLGALSYQALSCKAELMQHQGQWDKEVGPIMKWKKEKVPAYFPSYPGFVSLANYGSQQVLQGYQPFRPPGTTTPTEQVARHQVASHTDITYQEDSQTNTGTAYKDSQANNPLTILHMAAEFVANPATRQSTTGFQSHYKDLAVMGNSFTNYTGYKQGSTQACQTPQGHIPSWEGKCPLQEVPNESHFMHSQVY